jgi:hypothetical protein
LECFAWVVLLDGASGKRAKARSASFELPPAVSALILDGMELGHADDMVCLCWRPRLACPRLEGLAYSCSRYLRIQICTLTACCADSRAKSVAFTARSGHVYIPI